MKPITQFALELATEYHKGQKRKDGKDYITHPIAVAGIAESLYMTQSAEKNILIIVAAFLHDCEEDCNVASKDIANRFVFDGYFGNGSLTYDRLIHTLKLLNKDNYSSYANYIQGMVMPNSDAAFHEDYLWRVDVARRVKIADLTHNLSDLKPGSLRDKYELALYILTH